MHLGRTRDRPRLARTSGRSWFSPEAVRVLSDCTARFTIGGNVRPNRWAALRVTQPVCARGGRCGIGHGYGRGPNVRPPGHGFHVAKMPSVPPGVRAADTADDSSTSPRPPDSTGSTTRRLKSGLGLNGCARANGLEPVDGRPLPQAVHEALQAIAAAPLVRTEIITERLETETAIRHVEAACRAQFEDPAFVAELMHWIRFSRREAETSQDGPAARVMVLPSAPRWLGQPFMRLATGPRREAARTAAQVRSSSALMVFSV